MNGNGKGSPKKNRYYCYCSRGDGHDWELFTPKHEEADAASLSDLQFHLVRIKVLEKSIERVLFVSTPKKPPQKLVNLGIRPKKMQLAELGIKLHRVIEV